MKQLSEMDLQIMAQNLIALNSFLTKENIPFFVVIPPSKSSIYKEHLPFRVLQKPTPVSQLLSNTQLFEQVNILDLRSALQSEKPKGQLYHKTDTHWNSLGGYMAYRFIMNTLAEDFMNLKTIPLTYFDSLSYTFQGDITRMINLYEQETITKYVPPKNSTVKVINDHDEYYIYKNTSQDLKLLFFRDSFGYELFPFLNESFGETSYIEYDDTVSKSIIQRESPDLVILEVSERNIDIFLKKMRLVN